ncbi:SRPBCC family protein [Micromonospora deserti]|uniref:ATPase n=1 Tax=Micromonospora deserti TaxID=2070366 RepID=A0A2W2D400_9ACTN|nr:SRPBCC family protein [Micromonospora deserti]PZF92016.1 ATPase [Micromonospora deserti]
MNPAAAIPAIRRSITVDAPVDRAFRVFTESFDSWWPAGYHIGRIEVAEAVLEPREGGRWYERGTDGSECDWGRVLAWEPPHRLVLTWQITGEWQYDPDPANASEIEVRFTAAGPERSVVELEHRLLDRLVRGQAMHDAVSGDGGWAGILERFAKAVAGAA